MESADPLSDVSATSRQREVILEPRKGTPPIHVVAAFRPRRPLSGARMVASLWRIAARLGQEDLDDIVRA
jgi:hypothetical protein